MSLPVLLEQMENRWIAYVDGLYGCFSSAEERDIALTGVPAAARAFLNACAQKGILAPDMDPYEPVMVLEIAAEWIHPVSHEAINGFFASDVPPLNEEEVMRAARLFEWTYTELLRAVDGLPGPAYDQKVVGNWSIGGILFHTARGEGWYLERLGLAPRGFREIDDERTLLIFVHNRVLEILPGLAGSVQIEWVDGELWSPRKLLRRALWHRRDHTAHILEFREKLGQ